MTFVKSYTAIPDIGGALNLGFIFNYYRSKDIGFTITNAMSMGMSMVYTIKSTGYAITGGLSMGLTFSFSKAIATTVAPGITNKSITPVKDWGNSTEIYWKAQDPSNRTTIDDPLGFGIPDPSTYDIGFALKYRVDGPYSYYKITQIGNTVRWQIVNEEHGAVTIYCRIGTSGSYENYGTVADGGISSLLSKYVIGSGSTTIYAYAQASNKAPSSVVSL